MALRFPRFLATVTLASAVALMLAILPLKSAQNPPPSAPVPIVGQKVIFAVSGPVADMPPLEATEMWLADVERIIPHGPIHGEPSLSAPDLALQTSPFALPDIPAPGLTFEGLSNQDNLTFAATLVAPPDTNGDVGPNHYVQSTNLLFRVWDKNGTPLTAPLRLSGLFSPLGGPCALAAKGDPIVLYDSLADRWLISQFGFATTPGVPPYFECIAISQTSNPAGAYFLYAFQTPNIEFPDYPKLGVWPDAYYMTVNQFTMGGPSNGTGAYAFDRTKMLAGDPTANYIYFNLNLASHPERIVGMLPSDFDGLIPPPAGRPNTFAYLTSFVFGNASDGLRLFDFHADFVNPANSTFSERVGSPVAVAGFDPTNPIGRMDIQQPPPAINTTGTLDSISDRLLHRLQYRNTGSVEMLVTNHTVGAPASTVLGTYRAGVRYYQLTSSGGGAFSMAEQATFAPADGLSRWMGSAAADNQGNLAVGFSTSSVTSFPSIAYAGRLASDPPGGLRNQSTLIAGTGVQRASNRWGDYSSMMVDPADDCTFWYTNQYYTAASQAFSTVGWLTRIGRFKFAECTAPPQGTLQGLITDEVSGAPVEGAHVQISNGFSQLTIANGAYSRVLTPGIYNLTVSRLGYLPATVNGIVLDNGATVTRNVALFPISVVVAGNTAITAEGFSPPNGAVDAAETVTVDFTLRNIGPASTFALVATLLPTGGVLNPSGPQNYGAISPSGGVGARSFTFRADPLLGCGNTLTATLHLQDGPRDHGTVTFKFLLAGNVATVFAENFDAVTAPALPAGWTATVVVGSGTWATTPTIPDTPPNDALVSGTASVGDKRLDSPAFLIKTAEAQLSFRHFNILEQNNDGGVFEISLDGGAFTDILAAGGSFVLNGYNSTISALTGNPLGGRAGWSGSSGNYRTTTVNLPAAAAGKMVRLRWRLGTNSTVASAGWRVDTISITENLSPCTFNVLPVGSAITAEGFAPANGAIDPGENVLVDFTLRNAGTQATSNLVSTLLPTGGVINPSGPQTYGVIPAAGTGGGGGGGQITRSFSFRADPALTCGVPLVTTHQLLNGSVDLGNAKSNFVLGKLVLNTALSENFDGVVAPLLPPGWAATNIDASPVRWVTATVPGSPFDTPPNSAFVDDPPMVSDKRLDSPAFAIQTTTAQLTFRNFYSLENTFDGGVLEISLNGGPFVDILTAGGSFVQGGYNGTIANGFSNPLSSRMAWTGSSVVPPSLFITTIANLPSSAAGKMVKLRWRMGSDLIVGSGGWRIDSMTVSDNTRSCETTAATLSLAGSVAGRGTDASGFYVDVALRNNGTGKARNIVITELTFRTLSGTGTVTYNTMLSPPLPRAVGDLAVGASTTVRMYLNRPPTVTRFSITETGTMQLVTGTNNFSIGQSVIP